MGCPEIKVFRVSKTSLKINTTSRSLHYSSRRRLPPGILSRNQVTFSLPLGVIRSRLDGESACRRTDVAHSVYLGHTGKQGYIIATRRRGE